MTWSEAAFLWLLSCCRRQESNSMLWTILRGEIKTPQSSEKTPLKSQTKLNNRLRHPPQWRSREHQLKSTPPPQMPVLYLKYTHILRDSYEGMRYLVPRPSTPLRELDKKYKTGKWVGGCALNINNPRNNGSEWRLFERGTSEFPSFPLFPL